jgi:hypothetical protein
MLLYNHLAKPTVAAEPGLQCSPCPPVLQLVSSKAHHEATDLFAEEVSLKSVEGPPPLLLSFSHTGDTTPILC